jgi:hypothetical protein
MSDNPLLSQDAVDELVARVAYNGLLYDDDNDSLCP